MDPKKKNARAGYGVAIYETDADGRQKFLSAKYGRVVTSPRKTMYQGADKHSNNAGELTALLRAVQEERHEKGRVTFVVDSTYAINMATGRTVPTQRRKSANVELVRKLRGAYRDLTRWRGEEVRIEHVRSHTSAQGLRLNVTTPISEKRQVFTHQKRCYNTGVHTPRRGVTTVFTRCSHTSYCEYDTCQSPLCLLGSAHGVLRQVYSAARMVCFLRYKPWRSAGRSTCRQRHRLVSRKLILQN